MLKKLVLGLSKSIEKKLEQQTVVYIKYLHEK